MTGPLLDRPLRDRHRREFFATAFSHLNADAAESWPGRAVHLSPDPQVLAPNGDLIGVGIAENTEKLVRCARN